MVDEEVRVGRLPQFYANVELNTVTMCMDVRLVEVMKKHLPLEMNNPDSFYSKTPFHRHRTQIWWVSTWVQNWWPALPDGPPLALFCCCVLRRC